jgi:hypothetical protein
MAHHFSSAEFAWGSGGIRDLRPAATPTGADTLPEMTIARRLTS